MNKLKDFILIIIILVLIGATWITSVLLKKPKDNSNYMPNQEVSEELVTNEITNAIRNNDPKIFENVTQKILNGEIVPAGIVDHIDSKYIYYSDNTDIYYFEQDIIPYINGRTCNELHNARIETGDYVNPYDKQILVFKNISGDKLKRELIQNFKLDEEERILYVNSVEIEDVNIIGENKAIVTIKYGDIIGDILTDEKFTTEVEFDNQTYYYSKGQNIGNVYDLELAKGSINSIILYVFNDEYPRVKKFESSDT